MYKLGLISLGLVFGLGAVTESYAEEQAGEGSLAEIVVTAQKRTENVQDVPVSITVISAEQVQRQGVSNIADLSRSSASLEFSAPGTSSVGGGGFIRGIGTNSFGYSAQASVGIVLDGVVMGNANLLSLFDVERVEVLKGPQGTLFGNSVSAGVINLTTRAPDPSKQSMDFFAEYGVPALGSDYTRYAIRATVNLPISDTSAVRLSAHSEQNNGVFSNVWLGSDSTAPDNGVRIRYLAKPTDAVTVNLIADYDKATTVNSPILTYRYAPPGSALAAALADCGVTPSDSNFTSCTEHQDKTSDVVQGVSGQVDAKLNDDITLTSITAWRNKNSSTRQDIQTIPLSIMESRFSGCHFFDCVPIFAILPGYGSTGPQTRDAKQFSEELRLASTTTGAIDWVAGLFYQDFKNDIEEGGLINAFFTGGNFAQTGHFAKVKTKDYAAFGNMTFHITDALKLIAGLRYTHSDVSETGEDITVPPPNNTMDVSVTASKPSYRVGFQYDFAKDLMTYVTVATGYKGPQISDDISGGHVYGVKPEIPTSAEIGVKYSALDNRLAVDADVFYTKIKDYQGQSCEPNQQGTITCVPANISGVVTKGIELDIFGNPIHGLNVNFSGIYNPATYPNGYLAANGSDLGGTQLTRASKVKLTLSGEYFHPVTDGLDFVIGSDAVYRSAQSIYPSAEEWFTVKAGTIVNARLGLRSGEKWGAYFFGRNLGNQHFPRDLFPTPFQGPPPTFQPGPPTQPGGLWQAFDASDLRIVGLQFDVKF
jgi:iron complex outermembrane recepter protein